jgi:NAD(P)-dependent dehydrogenase (short-subunit alcohol dehydrogenase family)
MANVMITGGNRGIGFEFVRRFLERKDTVIPTYRDEKRAQEIIALETRGYDEIIPVQLEVRDRNSIEACFDVVAERVGQLDLLINNAGMGDNSIDEGNPYTHNAFGHLTAESLLKVYHVNAVAPAIITQKFVELMEWAEEPKIAYITSQMGSIGRRTASGHYSYNSSKAGLNMLARLLSYDLAGMDIMSVILHPGWVKTSMGGPDAEISVQVSVDGMLKVIDNLTPEQNGKFLDYMGQELPW